MAAKSRLGETQVEKDHGQYSIRTHFCLAALFFGKVSIAFFLAFMVTSVWVAPLFDHPGFESK